MSKIEFFLHTEQGRFGPPQTKEHFKLITGRKFVKNDLTVKDEYLSGEVTSEIIKAYPEEYAAFQKVLEIPVEPVEEETLSEEGKRREKMKKNLMMKVS